MVADPLRLFEICATSDGAAAVVLSSMEFARKRTTDPVKIAAVSTVTPRYPNTVIEMPNFATDSAHSVPVPDLPFRDSIAAAAYEEAGIGPEDMSLAEVYDLSSALELDWYENIGLCKPGEAEKLLNDGDTTIGGRVPVNPSGGLACFGEAVPAQAIAQVCELTWQLRGQAGERQVEGAKAGITANQGLFGHGSSVIVDDGERRRPRRRRMRSPRHSGVQAGEGWQRHTSSTQFERPWAARRGACPQEHPADLGAHVLKAHRRAQPRSIPLRRRGRDLRLRRHHRPPGRRHRAHLLAGGRTARGGPRAPPSTDSAARRSRPSTSPPRR